MARKAGNDDINRSEAIRSVLKENPTMPVKEVVSTLGAKGIEVKTNLVYLIKGKMKGEKGRRRKIRRKATQVSKATGNQDPIAMIKKVKALAEEVGGYKNLTSLIEALS